MVALTGATAAGRTLFAKNSDRLRDEPQSVELHPAADHPAGTNVRCTYISIPQAGRTHAVMLGRPWWMWGAEMGVNEHGVAIGNQAVFSREKPDPRPALLGMDLVRLGLERGMDANSALATIIRLLEEHGQGGNCAMPGPSHYDNSFLIADQRHAYVLETFGRRWMVEDVVDVRAISNLFTIGRPSRSSADLGDWIRSSGSANGGRSNYADAIGDPDRLVTGPIRWERSSCLLRDGAGSLTPNGVMRILRDHGLDDPHWRPGPSRGQICAHADDAEPRGQTVGSLVAELGGERTIIWVTASAAPCLSVFKPIFLDTPIPKMGLRLTGDFEAQAFWWRHDRLQRTLLTDESIDLALLRNERDLLETGFQKRICDVRNANPTDRAAVVEDCWGEAMALEERWFSSLRRASI